MQGASATRMLRALSCSGSCALFSSARLMSSSGPTAVLTEAIGHDSYLTRSELHGPQAARVAAPDHGDLPAEFIFCSPPHFVHYRVKKCIHCAPQLRSEGKALMAKTAISSGCCWDLRFSPDITLISLHRISQSWLTA